MSTATTTFLGFFDQVRIINLPSRADRRQETESEFSANGFPGPASCGLFFPAIAPEDAAGFPNRGVRGCYLSHLSILRQARDAGANRVLILEDDIAFVRDIASLGLQAVLALDEQAWDIAYFGHALPSLPDAPHWEIVSQPMLLAHCYAVNGPALANWSISSRPFSNARPVTRMVGRCIMTVRLIPSSSSAPKPKPFISRRTWVISGHHAPTCIANRYLTVIRYCRNLLASIGASNACIFACSRKTSGRLRPATCNRSQALAGGRISLSSRLAASRQL
jgi:hypothetical protein